MAPSTLSTESASCQKSPKDTEVAVFDPHLREAIYEKLPLCGRPLSYAEMLKRWAIAVSRRREAYCSADDAQEEYEDSASDIIAIIGSEGYKRFLDILTIALERHRPSGVAGVDVEG